MPQRVTVESVRYIDVIWPALRSLFLALHEYHAPLGLPPLVSDWEDRYRRYLVTDAADRQLLIARKADEIVAFAHAEIRRRPTVFDEEVAYINDMFVMQRERRRGIGALLLREIEAWAASRGVLDVHLTVIAANHDAIAAYQRWGFNAKSHRMVKRVRP